MTVFNNQAVKDVAIGFEIALASGREQEVHAFLEQHSLLFGFLRDRGTIKSKVRLADAFIPDFISLGSNPMPNDIRPRITFIEIERPNIPLFTKSGDPSSGFTHAVRQVQNWKQWVTNNRMYFQQTIAKLLTEEWQKIEKNWLIDQRIRGLGEFGFSDRYLVIAGRRNTMTVADRMLLAQMNDDFHGIKIITYDVLLDWLVSVIGDTDKRGSNLGTI